MVLHSGGPGAGIIRHDATGRGGKNTTAQEYIRSATRTARARPEPPIRRIQRGEMVLAKVAQTTQPANSWGGLPASLTASSRRSGYYIRCRRGLPAPGGASATWDTARARCGAVCPVWAWEAISADSGNRPHALLLAREVAVDIAGPVGAAGTPWIGSRRLRRCHVSRAHQSCICENYRED